MRLGESRRLPPVARRRDRPSADSQIRVIVDSRPSRACTLEAVSEIPRHPGGVGGLTYHYDSTVHGLTMTGTIVAR